MKNNKLKIILKRVNEMPILKEIEYSLDIIQELIGGSFDVVSYKDVLIIYREHSKYMKCNIIFDYDCINGDCLIVGDDYTNGKFKSLSEEQIYKLINDIIKKMPKKSPSSPKTYSEKLDLEL